MSHWPLHLYLAAPRIIVFYLGVVRATVAGAIEGVEVVGRREANLLLGESRIDDKHHAVDGQGRLGDVRRHHHLLETRGLEVGWLGEEGGGHRCGVGA